MSKLNNRQLLRFAAGSPATRPAINEATEAAAQAVPDIRRVIRGVTKIKKLGNASGRELALRVYVLLDEHGMFRTKGKENEQN